MKIYNSESCIKDLILADKKLNYCTEAQLCESFALASVENTETPITEDLYYTKSILVTTTWNKNDDIFLPDEVWKARKTVVDKPTNLGHDQNAIVGHITSQWLIDANGEIISEDDEDKKQSCGSEDEEEENKIPDFFHVCNGAVIYKILPRRDKEMNEKVAELIAGIEAGEKFVSMECLFGGFDYAILEDGQTSYSIVQRNSESAFLSKYLRAYGGEGVYSGKKIGRILRNLLFIGKGYVDKPANPDSVILSFANLNQKYEHSGVYNSRVVLNEEKSNMSLEIIEKELNETKAKLEKQISINEELQSKLAEVNAKELQSEIQELKAQIDSSKTELSAANEKASNLEALSAEKDKKIETLASEKKVLEESLSSLQQEVKKTNRVSQLVKAGVEQDVAVSKVEKFISLSDEQFNEVAETIVELSNSKKENKIPELRQVMSGDEAGSENADSSVLDNVKPDPETANAGAIDVKADDREQAFAALKETCSKLLVNKKEKV